jgi:hypothetical protein
VHVESAQVVNRVRVPRTTFAMSRNSDPPDALRDLEQEIGALRDRLFDLVDSARLQLPHKRGDVHVHLLAAANELGAAERTLDDRD